MENKSSNLILELTFKFAVSIVKYAEKLEEEKKFVIAKQVLRSGTSIGANCKEAQNAASQRDFLNKIRIAQKEAEETEYWLELCDASESYPSPNGLTDDLKVILKILNKIVFSTKKKIEN